MRTPLILVVIVLALLAAFWLIPGDTVNRKDIGDLSLPWLVTAHEDGTTSVLGLHLGEATLADAVGNFGEPEGIALFQKPDGQRSLECFFGTVRFGPLEAKVIVSLEADEWLLDGLTLRAVGRDRTVSGDTKLLLAESDKASLGGQVLKSIAYIPVYGGLDAAFFKDRLGEPAAFRREGRHAETWFYPALGLKLLIDREGKEVFEYVPPRAFRTPTDAQPPIL